MGNLMLTLMISVIANLAVEALKWTTKKLN